MKDDIQQKTEPEIDINKVHDWSNTIKEWEQRVSESNDANDSVIFYRLYLPFVKTVMPLIFIPAEFGKVVLLEYRKEWKPKKQDEFVKYIQHQLIKTGILTKDEENLSRTWFKDNKLKQLTKRFALDGTEYLIYNETISDKKLLVLKPVVTGEYDKQPYSCLYISRCKELDDLGVCKRKTGIKWPDIIQEWDEKLESSYDRNANDGTLLFRHYRDFVKQAEPDVFSARDIGAGVNLIEYDENDKRDGKKCVIRRLHQKLTDREILAKEEAELSIKWFFNKTYYDDGIIPVPEALRKKLQIGNTWYVLENFGIRTEQKKYLVLRPILSAEQQISYPDFCLNIAGCDNLDKLGKCKTGKYCNFREMPEN